MISYLKLTNFKSFTNVTLDLRGAHGVPKKLAFIYGENGAGKSNLMLAMYFICQSFETLKSQMMRPEVESAFLRALEEKKLPHDLIQKVMQSKLQGMQLSDMIKSNWMIGNENEMEVEIGFYLNGKEGKYCLKFLQDSVVEESLTYMIRQRSGVFFKVTADECVLSPSVFTDKKYCRELQEQADKFWGKHTFVAILFNELHTKNRQYIQQRTALALLNVLYMFRKVSVLYKGGSEETGRIALPFRFLRRLDEGTVKTRANKELRACEQVLNQYFTQLYSDIKRAYYSFDKVANGYHYELYFDKLCGDQYRAIPISLESTGTRNLLDVFPLMFTCMLNTSVFVDEVDAGIHDLLMQDVVDILKNSLKKTEEGQFIATTHSTLLMESLAPEDVYILKTDVAGEKEITCVDDYGFRTQKNNNMRKKYLQGMYQGIPEIGYIDFTELVEDTMKGVKANQEEGDD